MYFLEVISKGVLLLKSEKFYLLFLLFLAAIVNFFLFKFLFGTIGYFGMQ